MAVLACGWVPPAAADPAPRSAPPVARVTQTTDGGADRLRSLPELPFSAQTPHGMPMIVVDSGVAFQRVNGFGAALTDSSAWLIHDQVSRRDSDMLLSDLFGANGLHLQFLRLPIGASDFTADGRPYSYDDLPPGGSDPLLKHFSIRHDRAYIIPTVRKVLTIDPKLETLATPWSPPAWMKANHALDNTAGLGTLLPSAYRPLAEYFVKFIRAYASAEIRITAVTPQNEPNGQSLFPGLSMSWATEATWITKYLRPALRAAALRTKIYAADVGWNGAGYQDALLRTPALGAISGLAWHCYGGSPAVMHRLHMLAPRLDQVVSECATQITHYSVPEVVSESLRDDASTVGLWNLALNRAGGPVEPPDSGCRGCRGLITVDPRTHSFQESLAYYQLGQFSRFIASGARRIESTEVADLDDVAVRNPDGSLALVVYNRSRAKVTFAVEWQDSYLSYTLPPGATATFAWSPAAGG